MPYIHYIADLGQNFDQCWLERPETAFSRLSLAGKAKFLLEQNVLLSYLKLLYRQLPPLLQDYWDHCQQHYLRRLRHELEQDITHIYEILKQGSEAAREVAAATMDEVRNAMRINYFEDTDLIREQSERFKK